MKIAFIGSRGYPYVYSGYETLVSELVPRLRDLGCHVTVYCHRGLFDEKPKVVNGIHCVYIPSIEHKILSQFSHSFLATCHAVTQQYDVICYVNSANGPFGLLLKIFNQRSCINVDGLEWLRPKWKGLGSVYFYWASKLSTMFFDRIISDSTEMAEIYKKEFHSESTTIAYGANLAYGTGTDSIKLLGLEQKKYYLIVGRLIPDNNADIIVRGFEQSNTQKKLVVVGDVPYKDEYADRVKSTTDPRIIFPGYIKDQSLLKDLYANCYAYFHGHEFGGTNPTLLKALAYGCCIFALDTRFAREVLLSDLHGFYFQKNSESVKEIIEKYDDNDQLLDEKRSISRNRITENYTWEKIANQYYTLFSEMING